MVEDAKAAYIARFNSMQAIHSCPSWQQKIRRRDPQVGVDA